MSTERQASADGEDPISYEQWGLDFFREAISEERVLGAVNTVAGQQIDFGPMGVGPGRIVKVRAYGEIGAASATLERSDQMAYRVVLPVDLTFEVDLQVETHRFEAELLVPLALAAVACGGVRIFIALDPPDPDEVQVQVQAKGLRASVLQKVVGIEGELKRFVAGYVRRELEKPHVREARTIDVSRAIDHAWEAIAPVPREDTVTTDLDGELRREIVGLEETFAGDLEGR